MFYNSPRPYYRFIGVSSTGRFDLYNISTTDRIMVKGFRRVTDETKDTTKEQQPEQDVATLKQELADLNDELSAALEKERDLRKEAEAERDRAVEKHEKATNVIADKSKELGQLGKAVLQQREELKRAKDELVSLRAKLADAQTDTDPPHYVESRHLIGKITKPEQAEALDKEIELLKNNGWWIAHETVNTIVTSNNAPKMPTTSIESLKFMRWERVVSIEAKQQPDDSASAEDDKTIDMPSPDASEEGTDAAAELQEKAS